MKIDYELDDWVRQLMLVIIACYLFISLFLTSYLEFGWVGAVFNVLEIGGILVVVSICYMVLTMSCWEWHAIKNG